MIEENLRRGKLEGWGVTYAVPLQEKTSRANRAPSVTDVHRCYNLFHFAIWLAGNPQVTNFQIVSSFRSDAPVVEMRHADITVLFGQKADRDAFLRWYSQYSKRFVGSTPEGEYVPALPTNGRFRLIFTESTVSDYGDGFFRISEDLVKMWEWLAHNSKGHVFRTVAGFAFTDEKTAIEFKLRFPV